MWEYESGRKPQGQAEVIADLTLNEGVTLKRSWDKMTEARVPLIIIFCHLKQCPFFFGSFFY